MLGIPHIVDAATIDERQQPEESPEVFASRIAKEKALQVAPRHPEHAILGADTVVVVDSATLGKPESPDDAARMLELLAGREHRVVTAVALVRQGHVDERRDVTRVWFRPLSPEQIRAYVATGEPLDKAGAYGVQGRGGALVDRIEGDFFSVMGLPLRLVLELLAAAGMPYSFTR
jgi:septum formation protein